MQRICETHGSVKQYLLGLITLVTAATRSCPYCADKHPMRLHGCYWRWAITSGYPEGVKIRIQRLLCPVTGCTVSLLPDFCHPRRQYGPSFIGVFLVALIIKGKTLLDALHAVRPSVSSHAVGQSLRDGFTDQEHVLNAYVSSIHPEKIKVPRRISQQQQPYARLVLGLTGESRNPGKHFVHHAHGIHARFGQSLLAKTRQATS